MQFKLWLTNEEQSQDTLFMQTDKTGLGPKPSSNAGLPKPSDGWLRGKGQPALFMKKKMKRESVYWLEAEEKHPFEQWHNEYMNARKTYRAAHWSKRLENPKEKMVADPRAKNLLVVEVMSLRGYSSGV